MLRLVTEVMMMMVMMMRTLPSRAEYVATGET